MQYLPWQNHAARQIVTSLLKVPHHCCEMGRIAVTGGFSVTFVDGWQLPGEERVRARKMRGSSWFRTDSGSTFQHAAIAAESAVQVRCRGHSSRWVRTARGFLPAH